MTLARAKTKRPARRRPEKADEHSTFERDLKWYAAHRKELLSEYGGSYVAILNGKVVDSDQDFSPLAERVYKKYGYRDILMPRVQDPPQVVNIFTPSTGYLKG